MPRKNGSENGRKSYLKIDGIWTRIYDPVNTCLNCGPEVRAMNGERICHDCYSEGSASHLPTPDEIQAQLAEIRREWNVKEHLSRAPHLVQQPLEFKEYSARRFFAQ